MILRSIALVLALALTPIAAKAATVDGQIDISGTVNLPSSDFTSGGNVDLNDPGVVLLATGDFATYTAPFSLVSLTDIDFTAPGEIWSVGGFTFTASAFQNVVDGLIKGFTAIGTITGNGFDATDGVLNFSAQDSQATVAFSTTTTPVPVPVPAAGLLLLSGLGGIAALRRRKKPA